MSRKQKKDVQIVVLKVPFLINGKNVNPDEQARYMLEYLKQHQSGRACVLTYSANEQQATAIENARTASKDEGIKKIHGDNQAAVVEKMSQRIYGIPSWGLGLFGGKAPTDSEVDLRLGPISTLSYKNSIIKTPSAASDDRLAKDLNYLKQLCDGSATICNQHNEEKPLTLIVWGNQDVPVAIGGGVANKIQPEEHKKRINAFFRTILLSEEHPASNEAISYDILDSQKAENVEVIDLSTSIAPATINTTRTPSN